MKMFSIPDNVRQDLVTLVPAALVSEISCCVFYDNHPLDKKNIDITICTQRGEVKEFYQREMVCSTIIDNCSKPSSINILRNNKCEQFYLVAVKDEVIILSRKDKLEILHRINNVDTYELEDSACSGIGHLKIICKDDAVPLIFDDNLKNLGERSEILREIKNEDNLPILTQLSRKWTEVKYMVKCNEKVYKDLIHLRHLAAYSNYASSGNAPRSTSVTGVHKKQDNTVGLRVKNLMPTVIRCNMKIVVMLELTNATDMAIYDVHILLHETSQQSMCYTTKLFEKSITSSYWVENKSNSIKPQQCTAITLVIQSKEMKYNVTHRIELSGVISYKVQGEDGVLPFQNIEISAKDMMGENLDAFNNQMEKNDYSLLALLATTEKTDLCLRHTESGSEPILSILDLFCKYLHLEKVINCENMAVFKGSPYHILHGVLLQESRKISDSCWTISLFTRSPSQILAFIHLMHDTIPHRIVATMAHQKITGKLPDLTKYDEETSQSVEQLSYSGLGSSVLKQLANLIAYLDSCIINMSESKNSTIQGMVGREIDIFAAGAAGFIPFRNQILEDLSNGIKSIEVESVEPKFEESEGMVIDSD